LFRPAAHLNKGDLQSIGYLPLHTEENNVDINIGINEKDRAAIAGDIIRELFEGQEAVVRTARAILPDEGRVSYEPGADLLTQRMQVHEKNAWMLRSLL
jgi:DNA-binding ferritin-like protein